ncbi:histamine N-methyltransferase A-like [Acanthaster planci]|uniref:Histamine N-methyltransferase A-like n=1 Tax=Acanthaster planci TaxID=133434 RepID=A0A8B7Y6H0_ACAPL|nr:histamine N-methyltransferase A-like [Acanthaster planci]XP_022087939.1 histamine N-methyltransferase A-like [Acanthaster planci]XP_022087940.1 histamine N-methyltransferase A-like [Acanthaster planci]
MASLRSLTDDTDLYYQAFAIYRQIGDGENIMAGWVDSKLSETVSGWSVSLSGQEPLKVLSIGPGEGYTESRIIRVLRSCRQPHHIVHATIVEPAAEMVNKYKERIADQASELPDVAYDWRVQTLEDFQATPTNYDARFHFISSVHSIYYVPDLETSLKDLYDRLEPGGIMLIVVVSDDSGMGQLGKNDPRMHKTKDQHPTSFDIQVACASQGIPVAQELRINERFNINLCLCEPKDLSTDGRLLLDFLTHVANFVRDAPPDLQREVQECLANAKYSEKGDEGEVIFRADSKAFIIKK